MGKMGTEADKIIYSHLSIRTLTDPIPCQGPERALGPKLSETPTSLRTARSTGVAGTWSWCSYEWAVQWRSGTEANENGERSMVRMMTRRPVRV